MAENTRKKVESAVEPQVVNAQVVDGGAEAPVDVPVEVSAPLVVDDAAVDKILRHSVYGAMGMGIVPLPFVNIAALTGIHLNMVRQLSKLYGVEFKEGIAKNIIVSVLGAGVPGFASHFMSKAVVAVPVVGLPLAFAMKPATNGLCTYAVGQMFVTHFNRGGNFVTANVDALKDDFAKAYKDSRAWVTKNIRRKRADPAPEAQEAAV